jgi:hypothetical protein
MPDLPPYVEARDLLLVRALVRGERHDGRVLGWRGHRVYLTWSLGPGLNHLGWVPAADVERIESHGVAAGDVVQVRSHPTAHRV